MSRLTTSSGKLITPTPVMICSKCEWHQCDKCSFQQSLIKLAHYEDLEEQGLLLKLSCKVGSIVYTIYDAEVEYGGKANIEYCRVSEASTHRIWIENNSKKFRLSDIGKTVFLTKEEAEQKLKELNGGLTKL